MKIYIICFSILGLCGSHISAFELPILSIPGAILFECTTTSDSKTFSSLHGIRHLKKYMAVRADQKNKDEIVVSVGQRKFTITMKEIERSFPQPETEAFKIGLNLQELHLTVTGKPLSRRGVVSILQMNGKEKIESQITCH